MNPTFSTHFPELIRDKLSIEIQNPRTLNIAIFFQGKRSEHHNPDDLSR